MRLVRPEVEVGVSTRIAHVASFFVFVYSSMDLKFSNGDAVLGADVTGDVFFGVWSWSPHGSVVKDVFPEQLIVLEDLSAAVTRFGDAGVVFFDVGVQLGGRLEVLVAVVAEMSKRK